MHDLQFCWKLFDKLCKVSWLSNYTDCDYDKNLKNNQIRLFFVICCVKINVYRNIPSREIDKVGINTCTFVFCKCINCNCREMYTTNDLLYLISNINFIVQWYHIDTHTSLLMDDLSFVICDS